MKSTNKLSNLILLTFVTGLFIMLLSTEGVAQQSLNDLSKWETNGNWIQEENNVLVIKPRPGEEGWRRFDDYLWSKKQYGDFALELEYKIPEDGNSGVFVRVREKDDPVETGIEVQINDVHGKEELTAHDCGGVIGTVGPSKNMAKPADEWNKMRITVMGTQLKVNLNGEQVVNVNLQNTSRSDRPMKGYIGLQDHGLPLQFRNVSIMEL